MFATELQPFPKRLPGKAESESFSRNGTTIATFSLPPKISRYVRECLQSVSVRTLRELDQLREAYGSLNDVARNLTGAIEPIN